MKILYPGILACALLASIKSNAEGWSGEATITQIYPHSENNTDGTIYFRFDKLVNDGCNNPALIALDKSNKLSSEIYALLMMAFATDKTVRYYVKGCDAHGYPEMLHAHINK